MNIWLIKDGEILPLESNSRKMRTAMLADSLVKEGHQVLWWASTFFHQKKSRLFKSNKIIKINDQYQLHLLDAGHYSSNISIRRLLHHRHLAQRMATAFADERKPDLIICSFPIIEVAYQAALYAMRYKIPIVLDVRDLWPDLYILKFPKLLRPLAQLLFQASFRKTRFIFQHATGIVAISQGILNWALKYAQRDQSAYDHVVYHGYPALPKILPKPSPGLKALLNKLVGKKIFVFTGTFSSAYDLKSICSVAQQVAKYPEIHFVLAGCGQSYNETLRSAQTLRNISMPGWLEQNDLFVLLKSSYAGLLPWRCIDNAMPNKVFEYMASGLPILSSSTGDLQNLIAQYDIGLTYNALDLKELEQSIIKLAENTEYRNILSYNALSAFTEHFETSVIYNDYIKYIEKITGH